MKKTYKNIFGTSFTIFFSICNIGILKAEECTKIPTCEELGFTKTEEECKGQNTLHCSFDTSKIFCTGKETIQACSLLDILYSDMSCSPNPLPNKIPIGIVFSPEKRLAIALTPKTNSWSEEKFDIRNLPNISDRNEAILDWNGKENTKIIIDYCKANGKSCPAAEYAYSYSTEGTKPGDWYLPSMGELSVIASLLPELKKITNLPDFYYWSSTEVDKSFAYSTKKDGLFGKGISYIYALPVLAF